jgi:hypothetical protein
MNLPEMPPLCHFYGKESALLLPDNRLHRQIFAEMPFPTL